MIKTKIKLAAFALVAFGGLALAQGQGAFPNYPIVGGSAYCIRTVNNVCQQSVVAGPTAVTGNESIPANTNLSSGQSPQNVLMSMRALNVAPIDLRVLTDATSADTVTLGNNSGGVLYSYTTTIPSAAVTAPASPMD